MRRVKTTFIYFDVINGKRMKMHIIVTFFDKYNLIGLFFNVFSPLEAVFRQFLKSSKYLKIPKEN